ncbi:ABC transporter substrate-binding protein [Thioclava sp. GXIMD4216]|uniref:ABC transporter substrate-binding protein n=1 Tax=Thioclava sp. GXIMD4216 TaxID=3131929 RepID=UPI0030D177AF
MFLPKSSSGLLKGALVSVLLGASSVAAHAETTITAVMNAPLRALDPAISTAYILRNYGYMVYDTLLARDEAGKVQPQMASWAVSEDGLTYTFTLRDGLKWHDGTPVTAADCVASIARWDQVDKTGQVMAKLMSAMEVVDDKSFTMTFAEPTGIALLALSKPSGIAPFMMPKAVAETPISTPITSTIGSGPFKFDSASYQPGVQAVFLKNEDYVPRDEPSSGMAGGKVVKVDKVIWTAMPDPMTALTAMMSGEVDFVEQVQQDLLPLVDGNPDFYTQAFAKQGSQNLVRLNWTQPPFDNLKYREAAMAALGQKPMLNAQVGTAEDSSSTCAAVFGCSGPYATDYKAEEIIKANPEKSKELLQEAGYDGKPIMLMQATDLASLAPQGPVIAQQLRDGGFKVDVVAMDWASVVARRASKAPVAEGGWNIFSTTNVLPDVGDPVGFIGTAAGGDSAWFGWPDVPKIEELRASFAEAPDTASQVQIAKEIDQLAIDNVVMIPMGEFANINVVSAKLQGMPEAEAPVFWNVTKSE